MKYEELAKEIVDKVGGKENVNSVVHCITRLRFRLKDEDKAKTDELKNMEGVVTVMKSAGQYQVVIGNHVPEVYKAVVAVGGFESQAQVPADEHTKEDMNPFNRFIDIISSIFTPILGVLAATGMIKGLLSMITTFGWLDNTGGTYQVLNIIGDSFFYFLPIFLGYTSSKKFGGNPFVGMAIGASLVYPTLATITAGEPLFTLFTGTFLESNIYLRFLGIPVILMNYTSSVIPIILAVYVSAKLEAWLKRVIPSVIRTFFVPFFALLIIVPLTFLIIGPVATWLGLVVGQFTLWLYNLSPAISGLFIGGLWQVFVIFGLHWGLVPIGILNLSQYGYDLVVLSTMVGTTFAQIGAVLAVWIRTKNEKTKALCIPAFISGIFGVTEPAIYGVTLPLKKPFIYSCIGGAISGALIGFFGLPIYILGGLGIFQIPSYVDPNATTGGTRAILLVILAIVVAFLIGFLLTFFFMGKETDPKKDGTKNTKEENDKQMTVSHIKTDNETIFSPITGKVVPLSEVKDEAFRSGAMGKGLAIEPSEGKAFAPVSGTVTVLFPTNHAIGITSDNGAEVLIHIGMDTVNLNGKYFKGIVKQGDYVRQGQVLVEFDTKAIASEGYSLVTPIIVTNHQDYEVTLKEQKEVHYGDSLIELKKK